MAIEISREQKEKGVRDGSRDREERVEEFEFFLLSPIEREEEKSELWWKQSKKGEGLP